MSNTPQLKPTNQKKWIIVTAILSLVILALSATSIYFYKKMLDRATQLDQATQNIKALTTSSNSTATPSKTSEESKSNTSNNLPFLYVDGYGYTKLSNPDSRNADNEPNRVDFSKLFDKNGMEIKLPFDQKPNQILENNGIYYITFEQNYKQIGIWQPSENKFELKESPVEFYDVQILHNKLYLTEFDVIGSQDNNKCGKVEDEIGKCKIYELDPISWKASEFITAVKPGFYDGTSNNLIDFDDKYIWLEDFVGDGGTDSKSYLQFDFKTKKLLQTIIVRGNGPTETLSVAKPSEQAVDIGNIACELDKNDNVICDPAEQKKFNEKIYNLVPEKIYNFESQGVMLKSSCGDFEYDLWNTENKNNPILFKGKNILNLKVVYINVAKCIK